MSNIDKYKKRLDDMRDVKAGWYDGEGLLINPDVIDSVEKFVSMLPKDMTYFSIYPTLEGGLQLETSTPLEIEIKFDYSGIVCYKFDLEQLDNDEEAVVLSPKDAVTWLCNRVNEIKNKDKLC